MASAAPLLAPSPFHGQAAQLHIGLGHGRGALGRAQEAGLGVVEAQAGELKEVAPTPHFAARAKSVIFLFMCGGVSHIDTFDPKDNKWAGKMIDVTAFGYNERFFNGEDFRAHTGYSSVLWSF